jgi:hypothetical protein
LVGAYSLVGKFLNDIVDQWSPFFILRKGTVVNVVVWSPLDLFVAVETIEDIAIVSIRAACHRDSPVQFDVHTLHMRSVFFALFLER